MIAIPAIDLRGGACVQLVGGSYADERVRLENPAEVACQWAALGFRRLHVVDLDAATGRGENATVVDRIVAAWPGVIQVGGGIRSTERVEHTLNSGADLAIVGTRAIEDPRWLAEVAQAHPGRIIVAADVRDRHVVTRGWGEELPTDIHSLVDELGALPLGAILVTAVHVEGQMKGPDLDLVEEILRWTRLPLLASGGVGTIGDLRALAERGAQGAVIGMALYTGAVDARAVAEEFSI
jgi:phosphoribosylformimino-5-aminoimidazole carboxamide ribotide isomerase